MTLNTNQRPAASEPMGQIATSRARIWDLPTRAFHWLLVLAVIIAAKTGFFGPANSLDWHLWSGYAIGALIVFRFVWGLFGSEFSRLDRLFGALRQLPEHAGGLLRLRPKHYLGHNPAGSLMIIALALVLLAITATGIIVLGGVEKQGVLAAVTSYDLGHLAKGAHQLLAYLLMAMIVGHLVGVFGEILLLRVPLVRGMITGWLPVPSDTLRSKWRPARPMLALLGAGFAVIAIGAPLLPLSGLPAHGVPTPVVAGSTYAKECGACHWSFHPSLLPKASWKLIMSSLDQHFGDDASLPEKSAAKISGYLQANAAETADTEPANRLRDVNPDDPTRITKTQFWQRQHHELASNLFTNAPVKSKANCAACHRDALTGHFDDQAIDIPQSTQTGDSP